MCVCVCVCVCARACTSRRNVDVCALRSCSFNYRMRWKRMMRCDVRSLTFRTRSTHVLLHGHRYGLGAWNLFQYDCCFTPYTKRCSIPPPTFPAADYHPPAPVAWARNRRDGGHESGGQEWSTWNTVVRRDSSDNNNGVFHADDGDSAILGRDRPKWLGGDTIALRRSATS